MACCARKEFGASDLYGPVLFITRIVEALRFWDGVKALVWPRRSHQDLQAYKPRPKRWSATKEHLGRSTQLCRSWTVGPRSKWWANAAIRKVTNLGSGSQFCMDGLVTSVWTGCDLKIRHAPLPGSSHCRTVLQNFIKRSSWLVDPRSESLTRCVVQDWVNSSKLVGSSQEKWINRIPIFGHPYGNLARQHVSEILGVSRHRQDEKKKNGGPAKAASHLSIGLCSVVLWINGWGFVNVPMGSNGCPPNSNVFSSSLDPFGRSWLSPIFRQDDLGALAFRTMPVGYEEWDYAA